MQSDLLDMRYLSSIAALSLLIATLSWSFLSLLKKSYHTPITSPTVADEDNHKGSKGCRWGFFLSIPVTEKRKYFWL
jgi:hypothetical protein